LFVFFVFLHFFDDPTVTPRIVYIDSWI
jgi:hypothetical protein